ncbi:hypothetical protein B296_00002532 [Ensete ventricosum]|uniref:DUF7794 domain-containing protein n=1 Tax=Ensete ventricosum TaxID=4639 RepID=A0A426Z0D7_ENSVE|nr:hypothetical protein B296_00002532 [Ensete ventricosum]
MIMELHAFSQVNSMSLNEIAATISVLLGFAPSLSLPVDSSYKVLFAKWMGGSYVGTIESLDGKLTVPLASGSTLSLHLAKVQLS